MPVRKFVFVADYFADKVLGGAELSTQALIETAPGDVICIESKDLGRDDIEKYKDHSWVFFNVWYMKWAMIPFLVGKLKDYSIVEYDFKYCVYRSPDMHMVVEGMICNCKNPMLDEFFSKARTVFFMSNRQRDWHRQKMPFISGYVLSSIFSSAHLSMISDLAGNKKEVDCWAIIWSASGLKGFNEAVAYAESKGLNYRVFKDMAYSDILQALSKCDGLIYKPNGGDTCPRAVIEAKLMGLKLDLNYFVMHKDESWFQSQESCWDHLNYNKSFFWKAVCNVIIKEVGV